MIRLGVTATEVTMNPTQNTILLQEIEILNWKTINYFLVLNNQDSSVPTPNEGMVLI